MKQPLTLGFSPCPNDTFMFYPLVHGLVDTAGHRFNERLSKNIRCQVYTFDVGDTPDAFSALNKKQASKGKRS